MSNDPINDPSPAWGGVPGPTWGGPVQPPNVSPSAMPVPKVVAGTGGAGLGGSVAIVLPWLVKVTFGVDMPIEVALGFGLFFSMVGSFLAGYFMPPRSL